MQQQEKQGSAATKLAALKARKMIAAAREKRGRSRARSLGNCKNKETLDSLLHLTFKHNLFFGARSSGKFERKWKGFWNQALEVRKNNSSSRKKEVQGQS